MQITKSSFGKTQSGQDVTEFCLNNNNNVSVYIINYGCTITKIYVPTCTQLGESKLIDICLGYKTIDEYEANDGYLGAAVGRYANRIHNGEFELNGNTYKLAVNNDPNHLHGGIKGFDKYVWDYSVSENYLQFNRVSNHMEEGYPGNVDITISYQLTEKNELVILYNAKSDSDTPINLTNHAYFNLNGEGSSDILQHSIQILGDFFLENDNNCLPTGKVLCVKNTPFDFRELKVIGKDIEENNIQLINGKGYDHNWILSDNAYLKKAATLKADETNVSMDVYTTQPGVQFYSGNFLTEREGKNGQYKKRSGLCLETQHFPDSIRNKSFPNAILSKAFMLNEITIYKFNI